MKKELTLFTQNVPVLLGKEKKQTVFYLLNKFLPSDCKLTTSSDAWYVSALLCLCVTFVFPPGVLALAYCVVQAKKGGRK